MNLVEEMKYISRQKTTQKQTNKTLFLPDLNEET